MTDGGVHLPGSYDPRLVALSILVAVIAAYATLDLVGRVAGARGRARIGWLVGGAAAMGAGIWSMHFTGVVAFSLPVPISYDVGTVLLSFLLPILASALALALVGRSAVRLSWWAAAGGVVGLAIGATHYVGIAAMRLEAESHYDPRLVGLSVLVAVVGSVAALGIAFRHGYGGDGWLGGLVGVLVLSGAVAGSHYMAMAAVHFTPAPAPASPSTLSADDLGADAIATATLLVLAFALLSSYYTVGSPPRRRGSGRASADTCSSPAPPTT